MLYDSFLIDYLETSIGLVRRIVVFIGSGLLLAVVCTGQASPSLVDEFSKLNCEDIIARQDHLFAELERNSSSIGYAIISADEENRKRARQMESMFHGQTEFRRFDDARFKVIRASATEGLHIRLWIVPDGAEIPDFKAAEWDFEVDRGRPPFKINASEYDEGPCPIGSQFKIFSDYLKANPHARGHIVVWARTPRQFRNEKDRIRVGLLAKYSIDESRVRYVYLRHRSPYVKWEHWIVPGRIK